MAEDTRECPACALESSATETTCPYCGYEYPGEPGRITGWVALILVLLLIVPLVWFIRYLF